MKPAVTQDYFPFSIQIAVRIWQRLDLHKAAGVAVGQEKLPPLQFYRILAARMQQQLPAGERPVSAALLHMYALQVKIYRYLIDQYADVRHPRILEQSLDAAGYSFSSAELFTTIAAFAELFPPAPVLAGSETAATFIAADGRDQQRKQRVVKELLLLWVAGENRALDSFRQLFDDAELAARSPYRQVLRSLDERLGEGPTFHPHRLTLLELLRAPARAFPHSLAGQLEFIKANWRELLPEELLTDLLLAADLLREEERQWWGGAGPSLVPEFGKGRQPEEYPEYERFSQDADWMSNVVMMAKMVYVWLEQLSKQYGREIVRLDQIPDEELDTLARWGFTGLWLIGVWERSPASRRIKQIAGNPEALSSAYSLYDYVIADDLGGAAALANLKDRAGRRGIRLASDMVPNHTGIYSKWTREHPDWFVQQEYPPYPNYRFSGPDLSSSDDIGLFIEDGYWDKRDAAVVFKHVDRHSGRERYIYHGNDGTSMPWNDTAQLNYLIPEVREAVIRTIIHVARQFPIIRFDAAMTLAKKHYQRLWFPQPGLGGGVPSRAEHALTRERFDELFPQEFWREVVDRMAVEAPDTLLLAEAFWLMEGYFVRTLGMHRVYNSAFMNMLKMEENAKYRQTLKNVLEFNPEILKRFVNFMNNPDEKTAVEQFGKEGKYFGAAVLLVTMPGLPMVGHGQIEGFREKYGMEYRRAYFDEQVDQQMVAMHEARIFPLMRRRWLFSGSANFVLYDFFAGGAVDENVFAYSNRSGAERGIILYHNKFADTAGWIRTSSAMAVKDEQGETTLVQKTLGEALSFNPDGRAYYAFRDYAAGFDYLRSGRELCEQGLFVEFAAYEYHAFLDFREITDDEFGNWGKLCHGLNGRGVPSLDEEFRQVRYAGVVAAFRAVTAVLPQLAGELFNPAATAAQRKKSLVRLQELLDDLLSAVREHSAGTGDIAEPADTIGRELAFASGIAGLKSQIKGGKGAIAYLGEPLLEEHNRLLLVTALALGQLGKVTGIPEHASRSAGLINEFGLGRVMAELFAAARSGELTAPVLDAESSVLLVKALVAQQQFFVEWDADLCQERLALLFADPRVRQFLQVHWSDGVEWFNRERFELLVQWLYLMAIIPLGTVSVNKTALVREMVRLHAAAQELVAAAEACGYRVAVMRADIEL